MNVEKLYECPYCPRGGTGVVAVDFHRLRKIGRPDSPLNNGMDETAGEAAGIIVFNPDGVPNRPCQHLISFVLDPQVTTQRGQTVFCHTVSWDHLWFAANDPDQDLEVFLWTEVYGGGDTRFYPIDPFDIHRVHAGQIVRTCGNELSVPGTIIAAQDPGKFFAELADGYERLAAVEG